LPISDCQLPIGVPLESDQIGNQQLAIANGFAPVAQLDERDASNVEVAGSNPARSSKM
jgi:hypothetical protein